MLLILKQVSQCHQYVLWRNQKSLLITLSSQNHLKIYISGSHPHDVAPSELGGAEPGNMSNVIPQVMLSGETN